MAYIPLSPRSLRRKLDAWVGRKVGRKLAEAGEVFVPTPLPPPVYEEAVSPPMAPIVLPRPHEYIEDEPRRVENEEEVVLAHPPGSLPPSDDEEDFLLVEVKKPTPVKRCSPSTSSAVAARTRSSRRNKSPRGTAEKSEGEAAASSTASPRYGNRTRGRPRVKSVEKKKDDNIRSRSPVHKENSSPVTALKKRGALKKVETALDVSSESEKPQDIASMEGTIEARMAAGAIGMGNDEQGGEIEEHDDHARDDVADKVSKCVAEMKGHLTRLTSSLADDEGGVKAFHQRLVRELLPAIPGVRPN